MGEASAFPSIEAPPSRHELEVLALGGTSDGWAAVEGLLSQAGVSLSFASNAEDAYGLLGAEEVAFILVGSLVEPAEAAELTRRVRGEARHSSIPVVALSALGALEGQAAMLLELHRSRARATSLEQELEHVRNDLLGVRATNAELTELARAAQAELGTAQSQLVQAAKLAALGELVAGVAHEINNPLSFSLSHLSTLRRGLSRVFTRLGDLLPETAPESMRLEERLNAIVLGLDRIKGLVVKLQTFSRLDEGKSQPIDVADSIGTVLTIVQHRMRDRIEVTTDFGKPDVIHCDPSLINQCVMNLVVNAIDAIEAEGSIAISAGSEGDGYVIRVVDSGHGVPSEIETRIFEPFFTTKPVGKGTGLGLSIASGIVKKHEGTLQLLRGAHGGTEAIVRVPMARVMPQRRAAAAQ